MIINSAVNINVQLSFLQQKRYIIKIIAEANQLYIGHDIDQNIMYYY